MNRCVLNLGASRLPLPNFLIDIIMMMTNEIYPHMRPELIVLTLDTMAMFCWHASQKCLLKKA